MEYDVSKLSLRFFQITEPVEFSNLLEITRTTYFHTLVPTTLAGDVVCSSLITANYMSLDSSWNKLSIDMLFCTI